MIRVVLYELSADDGGYEEFGFAARGARSVVHRAAETPFENRTVDLAQFRGGGRRVDADTNAVGMKKIRDSGAFAKKFGIGGDAEFYIAFFGIGGKGAAELEPGARRHSALLDDEFGRFRFRGDLPGNVINRRKVCLAGIFRRGANTDGDGVPSADGFTGVSGIGNLSGLVS